MKALGALVVAAVATFAFTSNASAELQTAEDLHDARYCEILELTGTIPNAKVTVWNTVGLSNCPSAWWEAFDATALAEELGAEVVILNGPRHFLMDSATARPGPVDSFHGVRMRKVATIPIRTAADLIQAQYTERTVTRRNVWQWDRGRRVFELLAPDGSHYVMQSYSQIRDPELTIEDLPALGERLALPEGWSYRSRRLKADLALKPPDGSATIVQDDLQNTYQLIPRKPKPPSSHRVDVDGVTRTVGSPAPGTLEDRGTITGRPFGSGTISLLATLEEGQKMSGTFEIDAPRGTAMGTVATDYVIEGNEITFTGTAKFTGGTGKYQGIKGSRLKAYDHNTLDGQSGTLTLKGLASF